MPSEPKTAFSSHLFVRLLPCPTAKLHLVGDVRVLAPTIGAYAVTYFFKKPRMAAACDQGMKAKQAAEIFGVTLSWMRLLKQRKCEDGDITLRPCGGSKRKQVEDVDDAISDHFKIDPDTTILEIKDALDPDVSEVTVWRAARRLGYRFPKKSIHAIDREDVVQAREQWRKDIAEITPNRLIFLDESGAKANMTRLYTAGARAATGSSTSRLESTGA